MDQNPLSNPALLAECDRLKHKCEELEIALRSSIKQLRALTEEHQLLVNNTSEFVYRHDTAGIFHYLSPAVERITGYTVAEWQTHYTTFLTDHPGNQKVIEYTERTLRTGEVSPPYQVEMFHKDGTRILLEIHEKPYYGDGKVAGIVGVARDITHQVRAEESQRDLEFQVRHTQKLESLGVLAGGIAHDFNNLLASILSNAEMLRADLAENGEALQSVDAVLQASRHATELCRQMLTYAGKGQVSLQQVDLNALAREFGKLLVASVSKKAKLQYHFEKDLPLIEADISQIQQIIINLITNAAEALNDQSGTVTITTGIQNCSEAELKNHYLQTSPSPGKYVFFEVSDSGIGMDTATQDRIFEPFFSTKFTGRGLGLSAVLGIVRGHNGAIQIKSQVGVGTTIRIYFPVKNHLGTALRKPSAVENVKAGTGTLLLVDDDDLLRNSLARMLKRAGFEVLTASNGASAVTILSNSSTPIDCAIVDFTMPDMDGEETLHALHKIKSDLPVILASGYNEEHFSNRFAGRVLADFISKPFDNAQLIAKINQAIGHRASKT